MINQTPTPLRIQLKRTKGFNLQEESKKVNNLPAVNCSRMGKWGNPFKIWKDDNNFFRIICKTESIKEVVGYDSGNRFLEEKEAIRISIYLFEKLIKENDERIRKNPLAILDAIDFCLKSFTDYDYTNDIVNFSPDDWKNKLHFSKQTIGMVISDIERNFINSDQIKKELRGKNLACFCKLNESCHCDVLLKIAND
jgi:hypothetical protein